MLLLLFGGCLWALFTYCLFERASAVGDSCLSVVIESLPYTAESFRELFQPWLDAGAPCEILDYIADDSSQTFVDAGVQVKVNGATNNMSDECKTEYLAVAIILNLLGAQAVYNPPAIPWPLWITTPWEVFARSRWQLFSITQAWTNCGERSKWSPACESDNADFWNDDPIKLAGKTLSDALQNESLLASAYNLVASTLLEHAHVGIWPYDFGHFQLAWAILAYVLSLARRASLVSSGYSLRLLHQSIYQRSGLRPEIHSYDDYMKTFILAQETVKCVSLAPWPILPLLAHLSSVERERWPILATQDISGMEDPLSAGLVAMHSNVESQLQTTFRVADAFLSAAGIKYFAIAGTLLGALRHFGRIPWDDDVDLCVDFAHEMKLYSIVLALETEALGFKRPQGMSARALRGLNYLRQEGHVLTVNSVKALIFRVTRAGAAYDTPGVDIWLCYGPEVTNDGTISLMSLNWGPRVPLSAVEPLRKLPFGSTTIWSPRDPYEVTKMYLRHGGDGENFLEICGGKKVHTTYGVWQSHDYIPCSSLVGKFQFAGGWTNLGLESERNSVWTALHHLISKRLLALELPSVESLRIEQAHLGNAPPRLRAHFDSKVSGSFSCEALLWRSDQDESSLFPWAPLDGGITVRSLVCLAHDAAPSEDSTFVWEELWS